MQLLDSDSHQINSGVYALDKHTGDSRAFLRSI